MHTKINIDLQDTEWELDYIDHDRNIARAIVYDESGQFYFVRAQRDDDFGKATLIETAGGGVEDGEDLLTAIRRELKEELGVTVTIICKIGVVSDYYNLIHKINSFHLSTLKLSYEEAVKEYKDRANTKIGKLVANRELPVLYRAREILQGENSVNNRK